MKKKYTARILWFYLSICVLSLLLLPCCVVNKEDILCLSEFVSISYWTDTHYTSKNDYRDNLKHAQCLYEWRILLLIYRKAMLAIEIRLHVYLSFLLKISSFMAFNNNSSVLLLKTCLSLDYRSVSLKTRKSDRCSLALKYLQTATLLRPVPQQ